MKFSAAVASVLLILSAFAKADVTVIHIDGPKECSPEDTVKVGRFLKIHYTGIIDKSSATGVKGSTFDSSEGKKPFEFQLGLGKVIPGWDKGLVGLCQGAKAALIVPPEMGYGDKGFEPDIPGGATLYFEVDIRSVSKTPILPPNMKVDQYDGPRDCEYEDSVVILSYLSIHYTGTIDESSHIGEKGKKFDSSRDRGEPFKFQIGTNQVIAGWETGLMGLCKGAKATFIIPPALAYGDTGVGIDIPGGATLNFDVEVVDISLEPPPPPNVFKEMDTDESGRLTKEEVEAFFQKKMNKATPDGLWKREDKDGDGLITWDEFTGAKGANPTGNEL